MDPELVEAANTLLGQFVRVANGHEATGIYRQPPESAAQLFLWKEFRSNLKVDGFSRCSALVI